MHGSIIFIYEAALTLLFLLYLFGVIRVFNCYGKPRKVDNRKQYPFLKQSDYFLSNHHLTCCGGGSLPLLVRRLRMLLSDICKRADTGGILDSMLGSRVTSAFMSLRSSSSWFSTAAA